VVGRLKQDQWTSPEGQSRSKVSIDAEHLEFKPNLKGKAGDGKGGGVLSNLDDGIPGLPRLREPRYDGEASRAGPPWRSPRLAVVLELRPHSSWILCHLPDRSNSRVHR